MKALKNSLHFVVSPDRLGPKAMARPKTPAAQLNREIAHALAKQKTASRGKARRGAAPVHPDEPHYAAQNASSAAFRANTTEAHQRAAEAFRVSERVHRKARNLTLADRQAENAAMHDKEADEARFDWGSLAELVHNAAGRASRRFGSDVTGQQVFVADAFRALTAAERAALGAQTLSKFKYLLEYLSRRQLVNLAKADLPGIWVDDGRTAQARAASQRLVAESATSPGLEARHFIRLP